MGLRFQQWLSIGLSGLLLLLVVSNIMMVLGNAERQKEASNRQALIQQTQQVDLPLYRELAQALADLSQRGDAQIAYMLATQGIQVNAPQPAAAQQGAVGTPPAAAAPAAQADPGRTRGRPPVPAIPSSKP